MPTDVGRKFGKHTPSEFDLYKADSGGVLFPAVEAEQPVQAKIRTLPSITTSTPATMGLTSFARCLCLPMHARFLRARPSHHLQSTGESQSGAVASGRSTSD
jgi:hypothetical protein